MAVARGTIIALVAVLESHMERNAEAAMKPCNRRSKPRA
jgi:hypothetical protein